MNQVYRVLRLAEKSGARGVLVVPDWPASINMVGVKQFGRKVKRVDKFRPSLRCPSWWSNKVFSGSFNFDMLVFSFNFRK